MLAALALGTVAGFTRNIKQEAQLRMGEQQSVDELNKLIMNAGLTGGKNFSAANAKILSTAVKDMQDQIDSRERIDIFGRAGPRINTDLSGVIPLLQSVDNTQEGMIKKDIAGYQFLVPEKYSDVVGKPQADAILFEAFGKDALKNKSKFEKYVRESGVRDEMVNRINSLAKRSLVFASTGTGEAAQAGSIRIGLSDLEGYDYLNDFLNIDKGQQFQVETEAFFESQEASSIYGDALLSPSALVVPGSLRGLDGKNGDSLQYSLFQPTDVEYSAITRAAEVQGMDTSYFFHNYAENFDDIDELKTGVRGLTTAFKLGAGKDALSSKELYNIGEFLVNDSDLKDNLIMQARVIEPFRPLFVDKIEQQLVASGVTNDIYFSNKPFDAQFKSLYGYSIEQFRGRMDAFRNAKQKLRQYRSLVAQKGTTSGGLVEYLTRTLTSIFSETGTIDQLLNYVGLKGEDRERERDYLYGLSKGSDKVKAIAEADTLRYIIAADLARAEDPSGRLSDGDILRNLNKLTGFGNQNLEMELSSVDQVITDLDRQFSNLTVLDQIAGGAGKTSLSYNERRLLIADNLAGRARDEYLVQSGQRSSFDNNEGTPLPTLEEFAKLTPVFVGEPSTVIINEQERTFKEIRNMGTVTSPKYVGITEDNTVVLLTPDIIGQIVNSQASTGGTSAVSPATNQQPTATAAPNANVTPIPDSNSSMVVTGTAERPGVIGDGGTYDSQAMIQSNTPMGGSNIMTLDQVIDKTGNASPSSRVTIEGKVYEQQADGNYRAAM